MVCLDNTTAVGNYCHKLNDNTWVAIGTTIFAVVSTITAVVLIIDNDVLRRRPKESDRHLATRSNKTANTEIPEKERDSIKVEYACADESEDIEIYGGVTILENKTVETTKQNYKKEGSYDTVRIFDSERVD